MRRPVTIGSPPALVGLGVVAVVYAWWATGIPPFTVRAYVAVGIPALLLALAAVIGPASRRDAMVSPISPAGPNGAPKASPWAILLVLAVALECAGLALGGRASTVPTVSTVIDHAMSQHVVRFILFCLWLTAGTVPIVRLIRRAPTETKEPD